MAGTIGKRVLIPREHGAWAVLLMPYAVGVGIAGRVVPETALFLIAAVAWFAARYPLTLAVKGWGRKAAGGNAGHQYDEALLWLAVWAALGSASGALLLFVYGRWGLLPLGLAALLLLALQPTLQRNRLDRTVAGELLAFAGLALTGPGAYYVSTGRFDATAALVWLLTFLYTGAGVFYVKLKVKQHMLRAATVDPGRRRRLGLDLALYLVVLLATLGLLVLARQVPWPAVIAFVPLTYKVLRDIWGATPALSLRRVGLIELGHSIVFAALLIAAYALR